MKLHRKCIKLGKNINFRVVFWNNYDTRKKVSLSLVGQISCMHITQISSSSEQWTGPGACTYQHPYLFLIESHLNTLSFSSEQWTGRGASRLLRHANPLPFLRWSQVFLLECKLYLISYNCIWVNLGQIFASVLGVYLSHIYFSCTTWHKPSLSLLNTMLAPLPCPSAQLATKFWAKVLGFFSEKIKWFFCPTNQMILNI